MVDHVREHSKRHVKALYLTQICSLSFETETETIYDFPKKTCIHSLYWLLWGRYWATTARWFTHKRHIDHTVHLIITSNTVIVQSILNYIKYNNTMNTGQIIINVNLHFQCHFWSICATFPPQNAMVKFPPRSWFFWTGLLLYWYNKF